MTSFQRPDEMAMESEIDRARSRDRNIKRGANFASKAITGAGAAGLTSRLLPLLNQYVPMDLAIKGINKISPELGKFLRKGQSMGLDLKEGLDFIKNNMSGDESQSQQDRNIIEQYSPELHGFINQELKKGRSFLEAGALAKIGGFNKIISKIEKDHRTNWSTILQNIYGGSRPEREQEQAPMQQDSMDMQQAQGGGQGQQALMAILQQIQQRRMGQ